MFQFMAESEVKPTHILLDLGFFLSNRSSLHFSDEPLDTHVDTSQTLTAETILKTYSKEDLLHLLIEEGNVRKPFKLVDAIIDYREHGQLKQLLIIDLIKKSIHVRRHQLIAEITRIFQAIRVEVNGEINELDHFLRSIKQSRGLLLPLLHFSRMRIDE